ncbi:MAG: glycosyltransferase family 4 protein [Anaerolineae bacterium]
MRVLMLSWEYPPHVVGGLGNHVAALVPALARQGVEVHLITPRCAGGSSEERANGPVIHRVDPPVARMVTSGHRVYLGSEPLAKAEVTACQGNFFADVQGTNLNLEEAGEELFTSLGGFDLIHAHDWLVAFAACSLKRIHKIPLLSTVHATERGRGRGHLHGPMSEAINGAEWWLTYESWRVICTSRFMAQEVMNYFNVPADKVDVVPNGVSTECFDRLDGVDLSGFRARYAAPQERIVLCVGRIVHEKGVHLLVEAAPHILAQFPQAKFVVVGTGGMLDSLLARAEELGVGVKFYFTGFIPKEDRDRLYKVADCAVFPSLYEPFGIVALEAMAAKTPVVVSSVGGLAEVVQHNETGITVYPDSVESLAWGILHTLQHPEWAAARVRNAYRQVVEEYNWDRIARQTRAVYERIVEERRRTEW